MCYNTDNKREEINTMTKKDAYKKTQRKEIFFATLILLVTIALFCACSYVERHYYRDAKVTSVSGQLIEVEDKCGFTWEFYADGYRVGDEVRMLMDTHCTESNIYDDEIVNVKLR